MRSNKYINKAKKNIMPAGKHIAKIFKKTVSVRLFGKQRTLRPFVFASAIIGAAVAAAVIGAIITTHIGTREVSVPFESGSAYRTAVDGDRAILYNSRGARGINDKGNIEWSIDAAMSEPIAEISGDYLVLADLAGNHFAACYKKGKQLMEYRLGSDIISAKAARDGCAVFATDTDGYKGKVTVFNKRGRELYVWNSGSGYITDVAITDGGSYLAVSQLVTDGSEAGTRIQFIDTRRGEIVRTAECEGETAVNLKFVNNNLLIAMTDKHILGYSRRGKELFAVSPEGKSPSLYCIGEKMIAVAVVDNRGNAAVEIYSLSGKLYGVYTAGGEIRTMAVGGKSLLVAEQKGIVRVNKKGKEKGVTPAEHDIKSIGCFNSGRAVVIGTSQAETIKIK